MTLNQAIFLELLTLAQSLVSRQKINPKGIYSHGADDSWIVNKKYAIYVYFNTLICFHLSCLFSGKA